MFPEILDEYRKVLAARMAAMDLKAVVRHDFEEMDALMQQHINPGMPSQPNPMFSPKYNRMTPDRSFWIGVENGAGEVINTIAAKKFDHVDDLGHMWHNLKTFYDDDTKPAPADQMIVDTIFPDGLQGTISITGRGWVHPDYRKRGLARDMAVLSKGECLSRWLVDWHLGTSIARHIEAGRAASMFAYDAEENVDQLGFYIKHEGELATVHLHLMWIGPDDIVNLVRRETDRLRNSGIVAAE